MWALYYRIDYIINSSCTQDGKEYRLISQLERVQEALKERELREQEDRARYKRRLEPMAAATGLPIEIEGVIESALKSASESVSGDVAE